MGKLGFARIHRLSGIFRLCVCLVLIGIIILGAAEGIAAADVAAGLPVIKMFSGDPLTVPDGGNAVYTFEVYDGTKIQVIENGEIIDEFNGPPSTTSKGKANGRTTNQIRTGSMDSYNTILRASNPNGRQEKKLTIEFATKSKPKTTSLIPPVSDIGTSKKSTWGQPTSAPMTPLAIASLSPWPGQFAKCQSGCNSCLEPSEAATEGLTQKCLEQPCYYSPDKMRYWYCYGEPVSTGWCCKDGKVTPATEAECKEAGGSYWSADQEKVIKACQTDAGWFCSGGKVYQGTSSQATQAGVAWYSTEAEALKACEQECWCCTNGRYGQTTADACAKMGGTCYATQAQASERCELLGWFCSGGKVYQGTSAQATQAGATLYTTQDEAAKACDQVCWCCTNGRYGQTTTDACAKMGGKCYTDAAQAKELCLPIGYCCNKNVSAAARVTSAYAGVTQTTEPQCMQSGGQWFSNSAAAELACQSPLGGCCVSGKGATSATQAQCSQMGGKWTTTLAEAQRACEPPLGGCCVSGRGATSATQAQCYQMGGKWTTTLAEAQQACQLTYYCCSYGKVYQSKTPGTGCYTDPAQAQQACQQTYWCCSNGKVYQSRTGGAGCYASQSQAAANCKSIYVPPKTLDIPTPIVPTPRTYVPNVK
jgi:hypothetical protein